MRAWVPVAAVAIACTTVLASAQQAAPIFRSGSDAMNLPVAVFDGSRVVTWLQKEDFEVRDNGVVQRIDAADFSTLPVSLRLVFDTSGSISEEDMERYLKAMRQVTQILEPRDQCEIVTFDTRIADAAARQSPPIRITIRRDGLDGTAFFDAVTLAMLTTPTPDRRQITIVLSDAIDNTSFFDETTMIDAARNTDAIVYTILPGDPTRSRSVSVARLQALSLLTGGRHVVTHEDHVGGAVISALQEFRQTYILRYMVTGTNVGGWHKVEVKVHGGYRIRARPGYFARQR